MLVKAFKLLNEGLLRNTKESTSQRVQLLSIAIAVVKHEIRTMRGVQLDLQPPNKTMKFPLTNRWSNPKSQYSKQQLYMILKQVVLTQKQSSKKNELLINSRVDRCKAAIDVMEFFGTHNSREIAQTQRIIDKFSTYKTAAYDFERQIIFAQGHVNGQHAYMLRKFTNNPTTELPGSKKIEEAYITQLFNALQNQKPHQENLKTVGLNLQSLKEMIKKGDGVYSMFFEDLQALTKGSILENKPTIYHGNEQIKDVNYLQAAYPIFVKLKLQDGTENFICVAIGFRFEGGSKIKFFSPFFANQGCNVWRLAQSHLSQAVFNDFHIRVHLGTYHFTSNQYNYPIYSLLKKISPARKQKYERFLQFGFVPFNKGLQGVNVSATASLVHPIPEYSLVNKVFNLSQSNALSLIAGWTNRLNLSTFSPQEILKRNGIQKDQVNRDLDRLSLDLKLYAIISNYIDALSKIQDMVQVLKDLREEINKSLPKMIVGGGKQQRPTLNPSQNEVQTLKAFKNLVFCWMGYHAHTFSTIVLANYWHFRPSMLRKALPYESSEWKNIVIGAEIPHSKILMEAGKLSEATTQRDSDNILLSVIKEQAFSARVLSQNLEATDKQKSAKYKQIQQALQNTVKELQEFAQHVQDLNRKRQDTIVFTWLNPYNMQASLNI